MLTSTSKESSIWVPRAAGVHGSGKGCETFKKKTSEKWVEITDFFLGANSFNPGNEFVDDIFNR